MNPCSFRYSVKCVTTAKDLLPLQKTCRIKEEPTNLMEIGSEDDENEESASDFCYFIGYSNYIKNGTFEKIENCCREEPMMMDTEASLTLISIKFWQQVGELKLEKMAFGIETFDHHTRQSLDAFFPKLPNENKLISAKSAVVKEGRNFGLLGREILRKVKESVDQCFGTSEADKLPAVKGVCASIKLKQEDEMKFCATGKVSLGF